MFFKFLNKANTTQPLSEPQEAVSPFPENYTLIMTLAKLNLDSLTMVWMTLGSWI